MVEGIEHLLADYKSTLKKVSIKTLPPQNDTFKGRSINLVLPFFFCERQSVSAMFHFPDLTLELSHNG